MPPKENVCNIGDTISIRDYDMDAGLFMFGSPTEGACISNWGLYVA